MNLTETKNKLNDANIQLRLAMENPKVPALFRSYINNFIVNARSVTFVMQSECADNEKFIYWYEKKQDEMRGVPMLRFFVEQRNISLKRGSISLKSQEFKITSIAINGISRPQKNAYVQSWSFEGYDKFSPGESPNVIRLCLEYSNFLNSLIAECEGVISK